tara:strand:+ start:70946 stop:71335 length:390 start_codon:yes stop_codon:yes gene_type:complete
MAIGAALFFAGGLVFAGLLFASGGTQRSRQFEVLGQLFGGRLGQRKRALAVGSLVIAGAGAITCFAAIALMDGARAERCRDYCTNSDFVDGTIGPSLDRSKAGRFVACTCTAPDKPPLEVRADSLGRQP